MATKTKVRKALNVLGFIAPTILAILVFNIYPILFNTYISFTNRNQFHPNPDCTITFTRILEPTCWGVFHKNAPTGIGQPFKIQTPFYKNYADLLGSFFTLTVLFAFVKVIICLLPLLLISTVNKWFDRRVDRTISTGAISAIAIVLSLILVVLLNFSAAINLIMKAGDFFTVFIHTVIYVALCVPLFFLVGLVFALILNTANLKGRTFFRVVLIVPWAASTVAIMMSLVWKFFFQEKGTINQLLLQIGITGKTWLNDPIIAFAIIVIVNVWYSYPFFMVTILGALQSVPVELYEAAEVDGANYWKRLLSITLPLIRPAIVPAIVLSSISTFQMFGTVWAITQGGPSRGAGTPGATDLVMTYGYSQVFQTSAYARMGAFAVIIFIILFFATLYSMRISRISKGAYES